MATYNITATPATAAATPATLLKVGFGDPAQNDQIVRDASALLDDLGEIGGLLALVNGPASLPVAMVICHRLAHRFGAVACFDPKLSGYVVSVTHNPEFPLGTVIAAADVVTS